MNKKTTFLIVAFVVLFSSVAYTQSKYHPVVEYLVNSRCPCAKDGVHEFRIRYPENSIEWFYCIYCLGLIKNQSENGINRSGAVD